MITESFIKGNLVRIQLSSEMSPTYYWQGEPSLYRDPVSRGSVPHTPGIPPTALHEGHESLLSVDDVVLLASWTTALAGVVHSIVRIDLDENQLLQIQDHGLSQKRVEQKTRSFPKWRSWSICGKGKNKQEIYRWINKASVFMGTLYRSVMVKI